jgi:hypothetical protein
MEVVALVIFHQERWFMSPRLAGVLEYHILGNYFFCKTLKNEKMKTLELNACDVQEMKIAEMQNVDGGLAWWIAWAIAGAAYDLIFHTGDTVDSYKNGAAAANGYWDAQ